MWCLLECWLRRSSVSNSINTSFVERNNGTDRRQNGRKQRKTYGFSRDKRMHDAATYFVSYSYNFCWPGGARRAAGDGGRLGRPCLVAPGVAALPRQTLLVRLGHHPNPMQQRKPTRGA